MRGGEGGGEDDSGNSDSQMSCEICDSDNTGARNGKLRTNDYMVNQRSN